ncbi:MAG: hypothetical protein WC389_03535 [Lutibacter sp.]
MILYVMPDIGNSILHFFWISLDITNRVSGNPAIAFVNGKSYASRAAKNIIFHLLPPIFLLSGIQDVRQAILWTG